MIYAIEFIYLYAVAQSYGDRRFKGFHPAIVAERGDRPRTVLNNPHGILGVFLHLHGMSYSQFKTISSVKKAFGLTTVEGKRLFSDIPPVPPSTMLSQYVQETLPLASVGSEKARSELIIAPVLIETRRLLKQSISVFSGEDFTVDESLGLNGVCDFLISQSPEILSIEAPAVVLVEAKKADIASGLGQCVAEMVAAQRFNQQQEQEVPCIYGIVTNGILWRFLRLRQQVVEIDSIDYSIPPIDTILGILVWILNHPTD